MSLLIFTRFSFLFRFRFSVQGLLVLLLLVFYVLSPFPSLPCGFRFHGSLYVSTSSMSMFALF